MVGPPKTLQDLRRIEAAVRVTCRACKQAETLDREELISLRSGLRRSCDWYVYCHEAQCSNCLSTDVKVLALPFSEDADALRQSRARNLVINLALQVLTDAAWRAKTQDVGTPAVRLALRVLAPHVAKQELLVTFWREATTDSAVAYNGAQQAVRWITQRLLDRGYPIWAELR